MIGIDVGGANLKVVDEAGVHIHYCPLWTGAPIPDLLRQYAGKGDGTAAVVMSGELADCFSNKMEGIAFIAGAVREVFPKARFYGTDARFHDGPVPALAAANWLASADFLREQYPDAVLLDIGSTTADIIPLNRFSSLLSLTDLLRLQKGYLVYTGMLRTPVATLVSSVTVNGVPTPVSTEYFAASADAHLVLGHISPDEYTCDAPDGKEKTRDASLRRLARVVCADLSEIGEDGALAVASAFWDRQRTMIRTAVARAQEESGASSVIVAGIGAGIFAKECGGTDLNAVLGPAAGALPAYAVREVAVRNRGT
jgi:(4-(4-[2-(gamma-L-glutamylamino)ethyl]phenoxymethyl)furan-2-yl)methanamine synthase